ncbi:lasso peptide biosynthesis PqqD family chaperone [Crossiella sp. SN42]|uniref:lasso peptide biosynthesis PqqD family chaperone n=1 Tax=Crossiella sp. SN42 TaxID=2944808 RepID=UPI00207C4137|nr:lasso peptide biosynthesis PqqD family chaperone [Crossiella sp. SN42]MCO1580719.1 lasso peptide biosynthesis PqqD family chaperone [Crossiella sp. SN42]
MAIRLRAGVLDAETEYGTVLLDEDSGEYWELNPTATTVLRTLLAGGTPEGAAAVLSEDYAVDLAAATRDVDELVQALVAARLIAR